MIVINVVLSMCIEICAAFEADYAGYDRRADDCVCYDQAEKFSVSRRGDLYSPNNQETDLE